MIMGRLGCPLGSLKRPARNIASRDPRSQYSISIHVSMCFSTLQAGRLCIIFVIVITTCHSCHKRQGASVGKLHVCYYTI